MATSRTPLTESQVTPQLASQKSQTPANATVTPWPARRHTPYTKTPRSRRLKSKGQRRIPQHDAETETLSRAQELVGKTWRVYRVTPLYKFSHLQPDLKKYSRQLSMYLEVENKKGLAVDTQSELGDKAVFQTMGGVSFSDDDAEAIEITVRAKPPNGSKEGKVIFTGILCSVEIDTDFIAKQKSFVHLPVLLVKGTVAVTRHVISWLQTQFDCCINNMRFPPMELAWMAAMWSGLTGDDENNSVMTMMKAHPLELLYTLPEEVKGLNTISMTIAAKDVKMIWDSIHDGSSDDFTIEEMSAFIQGLESHFYFHFKIKLAALMLSRIGCNAAFVGTEGRLKILADVYIHQVLRYLTQLVVETLPSK
ncbi:centromere protein L-like [Ptychodera flava]|uniref:centromere protein L-like n=1 Tax=Ptychodera flava TaxID=63121 RepID=UPI00396A51C7